MHMDANDWNTGTDVGGKLIVTQEMLLVQSDKEERYIYETEGSEIGKNSLKASL